MELFSKEKELILKLVNAVLVIWFVTALVITFNIGLNILIKAPEQTFEEYKAVNCYYRDEEYKDSCENQYESNKYHQKEDKRNKKINISVAIFNVVAVGATTFILNRPKKKSK